MMSNAMTTLKRLASHGKATLLRQKSDEVINFTCRVRLLDEIEVPLEINVQKDSDGQWLFDEVCERLGGIQEKDYFGLRYIDKDKQKQWLDLNGNIYKQIKDTHPCIVNFRIKHYPANPMEDLKQEISRYQLYLQLRRDLYNGRLLGKSSDMYNLAACAVQAEMGDQDEQEDSGKYLVGMKILPNLNSKTEAKIIDIHKSISALSSAEAEMEFLKKAASLDTYGVEPFYVKDQKGNNLYVGLTHLGVSTFQGSRRAHLFRWTDITKLHFEGKLFIVQVLLEEKKHVLGFKCESNFAAGALWKWAVDRQFFFTLNRSSEAKRIKSGGGVLRKRKVFRFSGRCQREVLSNSASLVNMPQPLVRRATTRRQLSGQSDLPDGKFATMPARFRKEERGTSDTLDSLFIQHHVSTVAALPTAFETIASHHQSLDNIVEERAMVGTDGSGSGSGGLPRRGSKDTELLLQRANGRVSFRTGTTENLTQQLQLPLQPAPVTTNGMTKVPSPPSTEPVLQRSTATSTLTPTPPATPEVSAALDSLTNAIGRGSMTSDSDRETVWQDVKERKKSRLCSRMVCCCSVAVGLLIGLGIVLLAGLVVSGRVQLHTGTMLETLCVSEMVDDAVDWVQQSYRHYVSHPSPI